MVADMLKIFVVVVEQKGFSRAAEILNLSQPGVSMHIRNLENEFGAKLIHRSPKHVEMTEAGQILYERAKLMLSLYEEAKQQILLLRDVVSGTLKIGASYTIGEYILPRMLAKFTKQHPQVDVQVTISNTEEIAQAIRLNKLDVGLVEGQVHYSEIESSFWLEDEMVLIASARHPMAFMRYVTPDLLQDQVWVNREIGSGTRAFCDRYIEDQQLRVKRSYIFSSNQGVKEAVVEGLGIALLSRFVIEKELVAGEIHELRLEGQRLMRSCSILRSREPEQILAVQVFLDQLQQNQSMPNE